MSQANEGDEEGEKKGEKKGKKKGKTEKKGGAAILWAPRPIFFPITTKRENKMKEKGKVCVKC